MKQVARRLLTAFIVLAAAAPSAYAESLTFGADLAGTNESPPNDSPATGTAEMTFDTESKNLSWSVTFSDLTGPAIGAHIHGPAQAGTNAGILVPFAEVGNPIAGNARLNEAQERALLDGALYVNIHTRAHPGGEVRGQLAPR